MRVNLSNVEVRSGGMIPKGWYTAHIVDVEIMPEKERDGETLPEAWKLSAIICSGEFKKRKVTDLITFSKQTEWKLAQLLLASGLDVKDPELEIFPSDFKGKQVRIKVDIYRERNNISGYDVVPETASDAESPFDK